MARVVLDGLTKRFGATTAVDGVSLDVAQGELVALLGPSGCGKTTTLRMIAGFVEASAGRVLIGERDVTRLPPNRRNTGMVFQGYALFPHMSAAENIAFGLEMRNVPKEAARRQVEEALRLVRLEGLGDRMPRQLSGGQQQRVALARALVVSPDVFLLDEPLSNLDAKLRHEVRIEIRQLQQRLGLTTIFVTHDQEEALTLADRLVLMDRGIVQQVGTPAEIYERPANHFVADFIGKTNFLRGAVVGPDAFRTESGLTIRFDPARTVPGATLLGVRPEWIAIGEAAGGLPNGFAGRIERTAYLGAGIEYEVALAAGERLMVQQPNTGGAPLPVAAEAHVGWEASACLLTEGPAA